MGEQSSSGHHLKLCSYPFVVLTGAGTLSSKTEGSRTQSIIEAQVREVRLRFCYKCLPWIPLVTLVLIFTYRREGTRTRVIQAGQAGRQAGKGRRMNSDRQEPVLQNLLRKVHCTSTTQHIGKNYLQFTWEAHCKSVLIYSELKRSKFYFVLSFLKICFGKYFVNQEYNCCRLTLVHKQVTENPGESHRPLGQQQR